MKYACIAGYVGQYPVRLMCRVLGVSPSGFHAHWRRQPAARAVANALLELRIAAIHRASRKRYGSPRVQAELREVHGVRCGRKRVARLMRRQGLRGTRPRRYRVTTESGHGLAVAPNHLRRRFVVARRDRVWAADITYLATGEGWLYLAVVLDLWSRRVVGWALGTTLEQELVLTALREALERRRPARGLLHHSDRGRQYASAAYQTLLQAHGARPSMSRVGNCWDNAVVESFFASLKVELATERWATHAAAHAAIAEYIDRWYNVQRRHSHLGYLSPVEYELRQQRQAA